MKYRIDALITKLEEAKKVEERKIEEAKANLVTKQKEYDEKYEVKYKDFLKCFIEYHEAEIKYLKSIKTAKQFEEGSSPNKKPNRPFELLSRPGKWWEQHEHAVDRINQLIGRLQMSAEKSISVTGHEDWFRYIKF